MQMMQMQQKGMMAGKGMPMMGGKGMPPQQQQQQGFGPRPAAANNPTGISSSQLANAPPAMQKQMLGEKLYASINKMAPELAGKITGMMLEMDNTELLLLLDSPEQLTQKVMEARNVLTKAGVRN